MSAIKFIEDDGTEYTVKPPDTARNNHVDKDFSLNIQETISELSETTKRDLEDYMDEDSSVGDIEDNIDEVTKEFQYIEEKKEEVISVAEEKKEEVISVVEDKKEEVINMVEQVMKKPVGCGCLIM